MSEIYTALEIKNAMYPVKFRISIGIGCMSTDIDPQMAIGADGEAFHRARAGMERIRIEERSHGMAREDDGAIRITSEYKDFDEIINVIMILTGTIRKNWTERQGEIARHCVDSLIKHSELSQIDAAQQFGITQGTISKSLSSSDTLAYVQGVRMAKELIEKRFSK